MRGLRPYPILSSALPARRQTSKPLTLPSQAMGPSLSLWERVFKIQCAAT